jgi:hypothetical protein
MVAGSAKNLCGATLLRKAGGTATSKILTGGTPRTTVPFRKLRMEVTGFHSTSPHHPLLRLNEEEIPKYIEYIPQGSLE